jgi:hypothetical protein
MLTGSVTAGIAASSRALAKFLTPMSQRSMLGASVGQPGPALTEPPTMEEGPDSVLKGVRRVHKRSFSPSGLSSTHTRAS